MREVPSLIDVLPSRCEPFRIHLFGQPRFFFDGAAFKFSAPPRALPLLAFLLLNRDAHLTRDSVAFALWPDDDEETARTKLRRHLNYLKGALPPTHTPWIIAEGDTIAWGDSAAAWLDVDRFEACAKTDDALDEALELYAGDLLPAVYDDWLIVIRDRLRSQYLAVLDALLMRARSRRAFAVATGFARRILAEDPWREDALRQLMSIRYESGDRTGALHDFGAFAEQLQRELGVEPMPETLALRDAVLRGSVLPEAGVQPDDPVGWPEALAVFPFVGRRPELQLLHAAWTRTARGRGAAMLLAGAAGSGKSRLAAELALFAGAQGGRVLLGATSAPERTPYQSIAEALRAAATEVSALDLRPIWLAALSALVPAIELRRSDLPALPSLDAQREQLRLFEAIAQCLHALARRRPLLLVLEDLHWAGASTLAAFEFLVRRAAAQPILLLGTYRSEEVNAGDPLAAFRRRVSQENLTAPIALGELDLGDVREIVATLPALAAEAGEIGAEIHAASGGNALFVGELLRDRLEVTGPTLRALTLRQTIEARADRLSKPAQVFAEIASVVGDTFDVDVIRDVSAADENELFDGIAELLDRRIVKEIGLGRFSFAFAHHLIQQAIYGRIAEAQRRRWHRRVAAVLERLSAEDAVPAPVILARHYDLGGDARKAAEQYLAAAREARAVGANDEARAAAASGLALATGPDRLRFELLLHNEYSASLLGHRGEQEDMLDELRELATSLGDLASLCEVNQRSIRLARARSERNLEAKLVDELTQLAEAGGGRWAAVALQERATHLRAQSQFAPALTEATKALAAFRSADDAEGEVETLCLLAEIAYSQTSSAEMQHYIERARTVAEEHQKKGPIARATLAAASAAIMRREFTAAMALSQSALELYREMGDREGEGEALERLASAFAMLGRLDEARTTRCRAAEIFADLGKRSSLGHLLFNASATEMQLGLLDDALRSLDAAIEIFDALDDERGRAASASNLSMVRLLQGDAAEAKASAQRSLEAARAIETAAIEAAALSNLGNAERELREFDAALGHMHEAIRLRERLGRPATFEELADFALTQLESGDVAAAHGTARGMLAETETSDENTVWPHYCYWIAARIFRAAGDGDGAARLLVKAHEALQAQELTIAEPSSRAAFAALKMNRMIRAAVEHDDWPHATERAFG